MNHAEGTFESAGGLKLYYQRWLPDHGEPRTALAIVHGIGEHSGRFMNIVNHFVAQGHAVYALDLRGHGRSPGPRGHLMSWSEYIDDVRSFLALITANEPGRPLFLYAHSMGGLIGMEYVLRYPEGLSGVIISGPPFESAVVTPTLVLSALLLGKLRPLHPLKVNLVPEAMCNDPAVVAAYLADPLVHRQCTARWAFEALKVSGWINSHLPDWRVPLLLLHGEKDSVNPPGGARKVFDKVAYPDKKMHLVPGGYHEPHSDAGYEQVLQLVEEFVLSHLPASARPRATA
ncbi:alpha/beta hydrolase [Archangium lipolyticum]|uniref:alpha/beta hydrolase n=1 Tax=Archangium lipolyticum TaxID=2970465 RepID=UPI00214A59AD|nr:alpha/beta hydrolase [Archangium lipolyticum]